MSQRRAKGPIRPPPPRLLRPRPPIRPPPPVKPNAFPSGSRYSYPGQDLKKISDSINPQLQTVEIKKQSTNTRYGNVDADEYRKQLQEKKKLLEQKFVVNPYTSNTHSKYGAGGAIVGAKCKHTYYPSNVGSNHPSLQGGQFTEAIVEQSNRVKTEATERENNLKRKQEYIKAKEEYIPWQQQDIQPRGKAPRFGGIHSTALRPRGQAPSVRPNINRVDDLQARNAEALARIQELDQEHFNGKVKTEEMYHSLIKTKFLKNASASLALDAAKLRAAQGAQAIRKPVLYNPLAKQIKAKNAVHYTDFTPRVIGSSGAYRPELSKSEIPPPPVKVTDDQGNIIQGMVPPPPEKREDVEYDLLGNIIEQRPEMPRGFKTKSDTGIKIVDYKDPKKKKKYIRSSGGEKWEDTTLEEWDESDFRIFVGDLGQEVTDELLTKAFARYVSFKKAKVIVDKSSRKPKGYGFVALSDPDDYIKAMREMQGHYIGARPVKLKKSTWKERNINEIKKRERNRKKWGFKV